MPPVEMVVKLEYPIFSYDQKLSYLRMPSTVVVFLMHLTLFEFWICIDYPLSTHSSFPRLDYQKLKIFIPFVLLFAFWFSTILSPWNNNSNKFSPRFHLIVQPASLVRTSLYGDDVQPASLVRTCLYDDDVDAFLLDQAAGYTLLFCNSKSAFDRPPIIRTWLWMPKSEKPSWLAAMVL